MKDEAVTREDRVASLKGMGARASGSKTHALPKAKATMSMTSNWTACCLGILCVRPMRTRKSPTLIHPPQWKFRCFGGSNGR